MFEYWTYSSKYAIQSFVYLPSTYLYLPTKMNFFVIFFFISTNSLCANFLSVLTYFRTCLEYCLYIEMQIGKDFGTFSKKIILFRQQHFIFYIFFCCTFNIIDLNQSVYLHYYCVFYCNWRKSSLEMFYICLLFIGCIICINSNTTLCWTNLLPTFIYVQIFSTYFDLLILERMFSEV